MCIVHTLEKPFIRFFWALMVVGFVQPAVGQSVAAYVASPPVAGSPRAVVPPGQHPGRAMLVTGWVLIGSGATLCVAGGTFMLVSAGNDRSVGNGYHHAQSLSGIGEGLEIAGLTTMLTGAILTIAGGMKHENKHRFGIISSGSSMGVVYKF